MAVSHLTDSHLPRRAGCRQHLFDSEKPYVALKFWAESFALCVCLPFVVMRQGSKNALLGSRVELHAGGTQHLGSRKIDGEYE